MAARVSMGELIALVRRLVYDPVSTEQNWTDSELQTWLDTHCVTAIEQPLAYTWQTVAGERVVLEYVAELGYWEADAKLTDASGNTLTATSANLVAGRWSFVAHQQPPVYLTGRSYDVYAAAADALEARAAQVALAYDFSADGATYHRSQQGEALLRLARQYRGQARASVARMVRSDTN